VSSKQSKKFFRFEPKQTETQSVSVDFRFVSVFRIRFETTETSTSVLKQTEKNSQQVCDDLSVKKKYASRWSRKCSGKNASVV
jgi:hypothetical protein